VHDERREERVHAFGEREDGWNEPVRVQADIERTGVVDYFGADVGARRDVAARAKHIESAGEERRRRRSLFREKQGEVERERELRVES